MTTNPLLQDLLGSSSRQDVERQLSAARRCVRCGEVYREVFNYGTWQCRGFHPMAGYGVGQETKYQCCGRATGEAGCVAADHTDGYEFNCQPERVNEIAAELAQKDPRGRQTRTKWTYDRAQRAWYIMRMDPWQYEASVHQLYRQIDVNTLNHQPFY